MMKQTFWSIVLLISFTACSQQESIQNIHSERNQSGILFTSQVIGSNQTRASGMAWTANDSIGVYMKKNGEVLSTVSIIDGAENKLYATTKGDGNFRPIGTGVSFPKDGTAVDFIAYYPQKRLTNTFTYPIDITDQTDPESLDLMYSDNLTAITPRSNALNLSFSHQLSHLIFTVKNNTAGALDDMTLKLSGVKTKANFDLRDGQLTVDEQSGGVVRASYVTTGTTAIAKAILIPESSIEPIKLIIETGGKKREYTLPLSDLKKGTLYNYNINLTNSDNPGEVDPEANYLKWRETPIITEKMLEDKDLLYVNNYMPNAMRDPVSGGSMRNYSMLYSKKHRIAYWVAYPLFRACVGGSGRTDAWAYDPSIPSQYQANLKSGFGGKYDRGHQIPSGDRTCDKATNRTTFYYSNMTPQVGQGLNQTIWASLENKVRSWMNETDTVFVVTGAIPPKTNVNYTKEMAIPAYYFKVLARKVKGGFTTIGFRFNNQVYSGTSYMNYAVSVKELENETGFTFFPSINETIKATLDKSKWN